MTSTKREYWDSIAEEWEAQQRQALWRRHSDAVNSRLLRRWLPCKRLSRLLKTDLFDEVVSEGLYSLLSSHSKKLVGIDLSPGIVKNASSRFPDLESHIADVRKLPFENASFDLIVSISTLDHFESLADIQKALNELSRVLRPGGRLLLTLDNLSHPAVRLRSILSQRLMLALGLIPYRVGITCGPKRLQNYCKSSGLEVTETTAILHCPRALAVAAASLLDRYASKQTQNSYLKSLMSFERMERWPVRFLTGHFIAINACKPISSMDSQHDFEKYI